MTVVSADPRPVNKFTGTVTSQGIEYEIVYFVVTDSPLDGPQKVFASPKLPAINSHYAPPGSTDVDVNSFLKSMDARALDQLKWEVTCHYAPLDESEKNKDGEPTDDPFKVEPLVEVSFQQFVKPVDVAVFRQLIGAKGNKLILGPDDAPVCRSEQMTSVKNSNGDLVSPQPERDDARMIIRITRNEETWKDDNLEYINKINNDLVTLTSGGLNLKFKKTQLKMNNIQGTSHNIILPHAEYRESDGIGQIARVFRRLRDFQISYEIGVRPWYPPYELGWLGVYLDSGYNVRARPGFPDGNFGTVNAANVFPQNKTVPLSMVARDVNGFTFSCPQPLDGKGWLLETDPGVNPPTTPEKQVALEYQIYPSKAFSRLGL